MKNYKKGFIVPLVWTIVALLTVSLGTYIYINQHPKIQLSNQVENNVATTSDSLIITKTSTSSDSVVQENNPVALRENLTELAENNFLKTYTNSQYKFTIQYPSTWKYKEFSSNTDGVVFCPQDISDCGAHGGGGQIVGKIILSPYKYDMTGKISNNSETFRVFKNQKGEILASITLEDNQYKKEFDGMISSLIFKENSIKNQTSELPTLTMSVSSGAMLSGSITSLSINGGSPIARNSPFQNLNIGDTFSVIPGTVSGYTAKLTGTCNLVSPGAQAGQKYSCDVSYVSSTKGQLVGQEVTIQTYSGSFIGNNILIVDNYLNDKDTGVKWNVDYTKANLIEEYFSNGQLLQKPGNFNDWLTDRKKIWAKDYNGPGIPGIIKITGIVGNDGTLVASKIIQHVQ